MSEEKIVYKGFDKDLKCRGYQFEIGKQHVHEGKVEACASGFHSCEYPLDVFTYYPPAGNRFAQAIASGRTETHTGDSKTASSHLTIKAEISIAQLVSAAVEWTLGKVTNEKAATNTGDYSAATNTGDYSAATTTGYYSAATNTGYQSAAANTGYYSAATNTGYQSAATNTGDYSAATNTGNKSAATNTGDYSAATNTGNKSAATNTGYQSAAANTGDYSAATNTGYQSAAAVSSANSVAIATGAGSRAKAAKGSAIVLCAYDEEGNLAHIVSRIAGRRGVKADTWYTLSTEGKLIEASK